jgi:predicted  nucleic acid-binding Zn-ribbon protein
MGIDSIDDTNDAADESFNEPVVRSTKVDVDARRKLEQKLEELRLQKELRPYDFDL